MTKEELLKQRDSINNQLKTIQESEYNEKIAQNKIALDALRDKKEFVLSLFEHGRTSCSDENVSNGYGSADYGARCNKCHLIEILEDDTDNEFRVSLDIFITKIDK